MLDAADRLEGGFANPVFDAQAIFRSVMDAMARPATIEVLTAYVDPPAPLAPLAGALACTLMDADTPIWLDPVLGDSQAVRAWLSFHTGAALVSAATDAAFAMISDVAGLLPLDRFGQGTQDYPDRSTTLIVQLESLGHGLPLRFRGPGINDEVSIAPKGLPANFAEQWAENSRRFPRGVDLIFVAGDALACLPRSAQLVEREA